MKKPPKHLSRESKRIWRRMVAEYHPFDDMHGLKVLEVSLDAYDRFQAARLQIEAEGMTVLDKFEQIKPHPLLTVERDSRAAFLAGLKALNLDLEPLRDKPGRPGGK